MISGHIYEIHYSDVFEKGTEVRLSERVLALSAEDAIASLRVARKLKDRGRPQHAAEYPVIDIQVHSVKQGLDCIVSLDIGLAITGECEERK